MKSLTILSIALLILIIEGQQQSDLLGEKDMCTGHKECQSRCCLEPRNPKSKRGRGKGGRNRGRGGRDGNRRGDDGDRRMLKHDDPLYEDFYSGDTDDWFDGDRFCMRSDFCRFMGPEDGYSKVERLGRLLGALVLLCLVCGCCGQHYWYKK